MVGFAEYTNTYETRLGRVPFYRKGARGPDQLSTFASKKNAEYWANAGRIRDMRFAQANEYNIDRAIRSQRERYISNAMDTVANTRELEGLRGRTSMKLSRTGGALSRYGTPSVVKGETPMSLTVAGLANGDGVRAVQRASAPPMSSGGDPRFASSRSSARSGTYAYGGGARRPPPMSKGRPPSDTDSDTDSDSYRSIPSHELDGAIQNYRLEQALREQDVNRNNIPQSPQNPTPTKQYATPRGPSVTMADLVHHRPEPTMMDKKFAPTVFRKSQLGGRAVPKPKRKPPPIPADGNQLRDADMMSYGTPADAVSLREKMNAQRRQSRNSKDGKRQMFTNKL
jgi:hypothetical protein